MLLYAPFEAEASILFKARLYIQSRTLILYQFYACQRLISCTTKQLACPTEARRREARHAELPWSAPRTPTKPTQHSSNQALDQELIPQLECMDFQSEVPGMSCPAYSSLAKQTGLSSQSPHWMSLHCCRCLTLLLLAASGKAAMVALDHQSRCRCKL